MLGLKSEADINRDINNIEKSGEVQKDLTKLKAQLSSQESDIQRGHEVAQLATQIASREKIALDSNELQILLQEQVQNFKLGENEKDRLFKAPSIKKRYVYTPLVYGGILKTLIYIAKTYKIEKKR